MNERGSMSIFVVIFSAAVFLLAGLLVDGGAAINARLRAADIAEQGARAAADQIDVEALRATGRIQLLGDSVACPRAQEIVTASQSDGVQMTECSLEGADQVTVEVSVTWQPFFLSALGFGDGEMVAAATAGPDQGNG